MQSKSTALQHHNLLEKNIQHHYLIFDNEDDDELLHRDTAKLYLENPYPISKSTIVLPKSDPYEELLKNKKEYLKSISVCRKEFSIDKTALFKTKFNKRNYTLLPQYIVDVCKSKIRDPDVYFADNCNYNWYYTGGVLSYTVLNGDDYIVHPSNENDLIFIKLNDNYSEYVLNTNINKRQPVHHVRNYNISDSTTLLTVRQKYTIHVILGNAFEDNHFTGVSEFKRKSHSAPYLDVKFNFHDNSSFCTLTANKLVEIVDVDCGRKIREYHFPEYINTKDSFGQVEYLDSNTLIFFDRDELSITDDRFSDVRKSRLKMTDCDGICTASVVDNNVLYIATKHHLIKYDLRMYNSIYKYTHMLESAPYLISFLREGESDLICLGNQTSKVLLVDTNSNYALPLQIPSIAQTFDCMQLKHKIHIRDDVEPRLSSPTIGMQFVNNQNKMSLFSANTAGDLFVQSVSEGVIASHSEKKLSKWIDRLPEQQTQLILTGIVDMSDARFVLNRTLEKSKLYRLQKEYYNKFKNVRQMYDQDNHFGSHLEEIWLAEEEEVLEDVLVPEVDTSQKVSAWLSAQFSDNEK